MNVIDALNPKTGLRDSAGATWRSQASAHFLSGRTRSPVRPILEIGALALVMIAFLFPFSVVLNVGPTVVAERGSPPQPDLFAKSAHTKKSPLSPRSFP